MSMIGDSYKTRRTLKVNNKEYDYYSLKATEEHLGNLSKLPFSLKILLENYLKNILCELIMRLSNRQLILNNKIIEDELEKFTIRMHICKEIRNIPYSCCWTGKCPRCIYDRNDILKTTLLKINHEFK